MLTGPSEVLVIAEKRENPDIVAADLIAQSAHNVDVVARAILLSDNQDTIQQIDQAVYQQMASLAEPNQSTAQEAFQQSFRIVCESLSIFQMPLHQSIWRFRPWMLWRWRWDCVVLTMVVSLGEKVRQRYWMSMGLDQTTPSPQVVQGITRAESLSLTFSESVLT